MHRIFLILFIFFTSISSSLAKIQSFQHLHMPKDASEVRAFQQDQTGMIWIGTKRGLFSYNGYNLHKIEVEGQSEIEVNEILVFDKYLVVGAVQGLLWFDLEKEKFVNSHSSALDEVSIVSLANIDGMLWIGTRDSGLYSFDIETDLLSPVTSPGWSESMIFEILEVGDLVYVTSYESVSVFDKNIGQRHRIAVPEMDGQRTLVFNIFLDRKHNTLYLNSNIGLFRMNVGEENLEHLDFDRSVSFKNGINYGDNLLCISDNGLLEYDVDHNTITEYSHSTTNPNSLINNMIGTIFKDRSDNVWIGTFRGISIIPADDGVSTINIGQWSKSGDGNICTVMKQDVDGSLWIGGDNGLIHIDDIDSRESVWYHVNDPLYPLNNNYIRDIFIDSDQNLWISTDGGISHLDRRSGRFIHHDIKTSDDLTAQWTYKLHEDSNGWLYAASYKSGLLKLDRKALLTHNNANHFIAEATSGNVNSETNKIIYDIVPDENGNLWASSSVGIGKISLNDLTFVPSNVYTSNMFYTQGHLWSCTDGMLVDLNTATGDTTTLDFKVKDGFIYTFVRLGNLLWFSTSDGIYYLDILDRSIHQTQLPLFYCTSGLYLRDRGELLLGGEDVIKTVKLSQYNIDHRYDSLFISNILLDDVLQHPGMIYKEKRGIRYEREIHLTHSGHIDFELASYRFARNNEEIYYYNWDGKGWSSLARGSNTIVSDHLSSGKHSLSLCRFDMSVYPDAPVSTYYIYVPYPWYLRWWAFLIYFAAIALAIRYLIVRTERNTRNTIERQRSEDPFVLQINKIIDENMSDEDFTVIMLAEKMNVSQRQLSRKLKEIIDVAPVTYLRRRRMQAAASLLRNSTMSIQEVMYSVGFSNASYFSKCFQEEFGIKPKQARENTTI